MKSLITYNGVIEFEPIDFTKKHKNQSSWKRIAMIMFEGDICEYYSWFIEKRYGLKLNKPLRKAHLSLINDSLNDMRKGLETEDENILEEKWNQVKNKYNGQRIDVVFDLDVFSKNVHWFLLVDNEHQNELLNIRKELGLNKPFYDFHMSIGYATDRNLEHSEYIVNLIKRYGQEFK